MDNSKEVFRVFRIDPTFMLKPSHPDDLHGLEDSRGRLADNNNLPAMQQYKAFLRSKKLKALAAEKRAVAKVVRMKKIRLIQW